MQRRRFLVTAGAAGLGGLLAASAASPAASQQRAAGPLVRREWSAAGPRRGREAGNTAALTPEERAHLPVLTLPDLVRGGRGFDLAVQVGAPAHPMADDHHIQWIEVALGDRPVAVVDLSTAVAWPVVRIPLRIDGDAELVVRARCTEHGIWLTRVPLRPA